MNNSIAQEIIWVLNQPRALLTTGFQDLEKCLLYWQLRILKKKMKRSRNVSSFPRLFHQKTNLNQFLKTSFLLLSATKDPTLLLKRNSKMFIPTRVTPVASNNNQKKCKAEVASFEGISKDYFLSTSSTTNKKEFGPSNRFQDKNPDKPMN